MRGIVTTSLSVVHGCKIWRKSIAAVKFLCGVSIMLAGSAQFLEMKYLAVQVKELTVDSVDWDHTLLCLHLALCVREFECFWKFWIGNKKFTVWIVSNYCKKRQGSKTFYTYYRRFCRRQSNYSTYFEKYDNWHLFWFSV